MTGKIFGLPLILIIFATIVILPTIVIGVLLSQSINEVKTEVREMRVEQMPVVQPLPTVEATPTETVTPTRPVRTLKPATQSAE